MGNLVLPGSHENMSKFWERKEGKISFFLIWGLILATAGGIIFNLEAISAWLARIAENMFVAVAYGLGAFAIIGSVAYLTLTRKGRLAFKIVMTKLTKWIVGKDPVLPFENKLTEMEEKRDQSEAAINRLEAVKVDNISKKVEAKALYNKEKAMVGEANSLLRENRFDSNHTRDQVAKSLRLHSDSMMSAEVDCKTFQETEDTITAIISHLQRALDASEIEINKMKGFIRNLRNKIATGEAVGVASKSLRELFSTDADEEEILRMAAGIIDERYATEFGEYESLFRETQKIFTDIDIESGANLKEALARIEGATSGPAQLSYEGNEVIDVKHTVMQATKPFADTAYASLRRPPDGQSRS
jgi:hypothetical protein